METTAVNRRPARYVPALHFQWLTPLYDPVLRWAFREMAFKPRLAELAALRPGQKALDVGCGTGTLTWLLAASEPRAAVIGIDGDPAVIERARRKAVVPAGVRWDQGLANELPYPDEDFDLVVMSLMLHHLDRVGREQALREAARVLRPGGTLLVAEFGPPANPLQRALARVGQLLEDTADGVEGRLPSMFEDAGLTAVESPGAYHTVLGTITLYRSWKGRRRNP